MIKIHSETLIPTEEHFRIAAGPGAGKTYWLINHIKNVLHQTKRLKKTRKIACITYTNIAVDTILKRLGTNIHQVEVMTLHSFLYKHLLKPYASYLGNEYELNIKKMDGHQDPVLHFKKVKHWIETHPNSDQLVNPYSVNQLIKLRQNIESVTRWLKSLKYHIDKNGDISLTCDNKQAYYINEEDEQKYLNKTCLNILSLDLLAYKKLYWLKGILDHNDVLLFSYQLLKKYPFILNVIRSKFPYLFIDEFQDTNPIQIEILKLIGAQETIVGIIGDEAQSIFGFQGANPDQFSSFKLPGLVDYVMEDNRRSTNSIIDILNIIRKDIKQNKIRNIEGDIPKLLVGNRMAALDWVKKYCNKDEDICSLSRDNPTSNAMRRDYNEQYMNDKLIEEFINVDKSSSSNKYRSKVIISCLKAVEYAREGDIKKAIKELESLDGDINDTDERKKIALKSLHLLLGKYDNYKNKPLYDFYLLVKNNVKTEISKLGRGAAATFYETNTYEQLTLCVNISEDFSKHKTIHKSKGDEFDNVLIVFNSSDALEVFLNPDLKKKEEHRISYVALSRARERLFITVPEINDDLTRRLKPIFDIELV
ncbi:UvrD-helicase domain-containing protein [Paenibacillus sp. LK1]|uniref:UvrD-helicase domain-containing protein n=1 Tax=Paenibacillus sp. LK1 TaxID=2053014 RepID=UPI000C1A1A49|nr:ATP-dependent helicase [Paenibacillus sp. LK1]PIH55412.1 DNA helicase UvrD [Paenibacillus sp. LK1]